MEERRAYETPSGIQLEALGQLESSLPAPLKKRSGAALVALALVLVSVFVVGGFKLKGQYNAVQEMYLSGKDADGYSYNISERLQARTDTAANIITVGRQVLGEEDARVAQAQTALEELKTARKEEGPAGQFAANSALGAAVDSLYQAASADGDDAKFDSLQTQWSAFLSCQDQIDHMANNTMIKGQEAYNDVAAAYNETAAGFPAGVLANLWGCGEVELFA